MKVVTLTTLWPNQQQPLHGLFVRERTRALAHLCDVHVVAPVPWFPPVKIFGSRYFSYSQVQRREQNEKLEIVHPRFFVTPKICLSLHGTLMFYSIRHTVMRLRSEFPFDLIDAHWAYPDGYAAIGIAEQLKVPCTVTVRGSDITDFARKGRRASLIHQCLLKADRVIAVSSDLKNKVAAMGIPEQKIDIISNGVDHRKFQAVPQIEARRRLKLPLKAKIILSVGQLRELKGFHLLIDALKHLEKVSHTTGPVYLYIVGGEPQGDSFKSALLRKINASRSQDRIILAGPQPHDELKFWYSAADLFCLASSREGCPNVILESFACGTPVIATAVGGIPELISDPDFGIVVDRKAECFSLAIQSALTRSWNHGQIADFFRAHYSWEFAAKRIHSIFEALLKH